MSSSIELPNNKNYNHIKPSNIPLLYPTRHYNVNDSVTVLELKSIIGYKYNSSKELYYYLVAFFTGGLSLILSLWFPKLFISYRYIECDMIDADFLFFETEHDSDLIKIQPILNNYNNGDYLFNNQILGSSLDPRSRMAIFRYIRFVFNPTTADYEALDTYSTCTRTRINDLLSKGMSNSDAVAWLNLYGKNLLDIAVTPWYTILINEVFQPFFVFQIYSVILWCCEEYYIFAGCIFFLASISICITIKETKESLTRISEMARFECDVQVLRDGKFTTTSSSNLVIGDIVSLENNMHVPVDLVLLKGSAVINESMLTGESIPVVKTALDFSINNISEIGKDQQRTIFSATKVLQIKPAEVNGNVLAMVVRTGFQTTKGSLILSILYPRPSFFRFQQQSYQFITGLYCVALIGLVITIVKLNELGFAPEDMVLKALDLTTIVIPPTLPLAMSVGTNFALICLHPLKIYCISPGRINMAGKVKLFCFDKTGTLTSDGLEMRGVCSASNKKFGDLLTKVFDLDDISFFCMSCCHALASMLDENGKSVLVGDPLEVQVFKFTEAILHDAPSNDHRFTIDHEDRSLHSKIKIQYEFRADLKRMSVVAEKGGKYYSLVKGSPESLKTLCTSDSIPEDYDKKLASFTNEGYRVISIAYKELVSLPENSDSSRVFVESDLTFLGFVIMENKLKPETAPVMNTLRDAFVRCVMVTGDNPLTSICVAKDSNMLAALTDIYLGSLEGDQVVWTCTSDASKKLDPVTLLPVNPTEQDTRFELAVTGDIFAFLYQNYLSSVQNAFGSVSTGDVKVDISESKLSGTSRAAIVVKESLLSKMDYTHEIMQGFLEKSFFHKVLCGTQIFARMTPIQKSEVIYEFQQLGFYVGMVGDGANDCVALKTAHVGISLSESDASIAAPFTYLMPNIECVPILLREGRSSLVTCFQLFRFMAMYSMIQFIAIIHCYFKGTVFGNYQYLYQDLFIVFPLTILMGMTYAADELTPKRPSGNLLSIRNLTTTFGQILICTTFQIIVFVLTQYQDGYEIVAGEDGDIYWETTSMYYISSLQYLIQARILCFGRPWKVAPFNNIGFSLWFIIATVCTLCLVLIPLTENGTNQIFLVIDDTNFPVEWRNKIVYIAIANLVTSVAYEFIIVPLVNAFYTSSAQIGSEFGKGIPKFGSFAKPFHKLRQKFELGYCKQG